MRNALAKSLRRAYVKKYGKLNKAHYRRIKRHVTSLSHIERGKL